MKIKTNLLMLTSLLIVGCGSVNNAKNDKELINDNINVIVGHHEIQSSIIERSGKILNQLVRAHV